MAIANASIGDMVPGTVDVAVDGVIPPPPGFEIPVDANPVMPEEQQANVSSPLMSAEETQPAMPFEKFDDSENTESLPKEAEEPVLVADEEPPLASAEPAPSIETASTPVAPSPDGFFSPNGRIISRRVDQANAELNIRSIRNRTLQYVVEAFFKTNVLDDQITVQGVTIKNNNTEGIWEEGGATEQRGFAILATDAEGRPLEATYVHVRNNVVNGQHALIPIKVGDHFLMAGQQDETVFIAVYRVDEILKPESTKPYPRFGSHLIAHAAFNESVGNDFIVTPITEEGHSWTAAHPAIMAAKERIFEVHATLPAYIADYSTHRFDASDFNDAVSDTDFTSRLKLFTDLEQAYDHASEVLGNAVSECTSKAEHVVLSVSLTYFPQYDAVAVFCMGVVFNTETKTSRGNRRMYSRVIIKQGESFYYPDRDEKRAVPFDRLKEILTTAGGAMAASFRRMTEHK